MNRAALRFWGSAAATSIAFAALVPLLFPFRAMGLNPAADRDRVWLAVVFCTGVMLVLFGAGAWIGGTRSVGLREILDAGGVKPALDRAAARKHDADQAGYTGNAAAWCVVTGALLIVIYFALFAALG